MVSKKIFIPRLTALSIMLLLFSGVFAFDATEFNQKDDQGRKQGYWQIKGFMSTDASYSAESVVEEGTYVDDRKEGLWKKYFPNGNIKSEISYINDRPNGIYSVYYSNGNLEEKGNWARNKNTGEFKRFHTNGKPQQEFFFNDKGIRNGTQRYFHENGQLSLEVAIVDGKESGVMRRWDEKGKLTEEKNLADGKLIEGSIVRFDNAKNSTEPAMEIPADAKVSEPTKDKTNLAHKFNGNGENVLYNQNQQVTQVGEFKNGRLWNGKWNRYDAQGILSRIEVYKNGKYVGDGVIEDQP